MQTSRYSFLVQRFLVKDMMCMQHEAYRACGKWLLFSEDEETTQDGRAGAGYTAPMSCSDYRESLLAHS